MKRNLFAGSNRIEGMGLNLFTDDELYAIHCATLEVLHKTGIKVECDHALEMFHSGGADVDRNSRMVKIPPYMVEDAIRSAPSTLFLAGRNPQNDLVLEGGRVGFTNFGEGIRVIDPYTREYRKTTKQDVANTALICDAMSEIDVYERAVAAQDEHPLSAALHEAEAYFHNTSKHCFSGANNAKNLRKIIKMAETIVGGKEKLKERPIYSTLVCPTSPLQLVKDCTEVIIEAAESGIVTNVLSMAMAGGSAPVTLAGTLVVHNAEVLSGIVLSQVVKKGAPVIYGSSTTIMDLKYTTAPVGSPELGMINAGVAKLAQYYLLPSWVAGG